MTTGSVTAPAPGAAAPVPPKAERTHFGRRRRRRETAAGWLFIAPDLLGLLAFVVVPMGLALAVSLYNVDGFGNYTFVGLDNFRAMAHDSTLWQSVKVSLLYVVIFVPVTFVLGLGIALLVRDYFPGVAAVRTLFFLPNALSLVVIGLLWQFMLVDKKGVLTQAAQPLGLGKVSFLGDPSWALWTYIAISVWYTMGYQMLLFLAGLKDIDVEYLEAARVDGAGPIARFRYIIWPLLRPTSFFVVVTSLVGAMTGLQAFDLVYVLTKGGPDNRTSTIVFYIYQRAFQFGDYGYAAAMTALLIAFLILITGAMFAFTRGGRFHAD